MNPHPSKALENPMVFRKIILSSLLLALFMVAVPVHAKEPVVRRDCEPFACQLARKQDEGSSDESPLDLDQAKRQVEALVEKELP